MAHVIAMAGKGGVGKTTLCGLLIQYLCETGRKPVLAVDADANSNLNEVLGVEVESTLGEIREEIERAGTNALPVGMQKSTWAEMRLNDALVEDNDFDLLVMGVPRGKAATALSMACCKRRCKSWREIIPTSWWTMRPDWNISAGACCPT